MGRDLGLCRSPHVVLVVERKLKMMLLLRLLRWASEVEASRRRGWRMGRRLARIDDVSRMGVVGRGWWLQSYERGMVAES